MIVIDGETETKYYYHFDGLGSVVALSNVNGDIVEQYSYDVFGEPNRVSDVNNPYLFTGRRYDDESGLYYYRARYYKPRIGRFLQTDPIPALNLYTYCGNNPLNFVDSDGMHPAALQRMYCRNLEYTPMPSLSDYYYGWHWNKWLFEAWDQGTGPEKWTFRGKHPYVNLMKNAPGVSKARWNYRANNTGKCKKQSHTEPYYFGPLMLEPISSGLNPARQFLGSYNIHIIPNADGTRTVKVENTTSMASYTRLRRYIGLELEQSWPRSVHRPRGNMCQEIIWNEPDN